MPHLRPPRAVLALALAASALVSACDSGPPTYTLQQVMYELDHGQKQAVEGIKTSDMAAVLQGMQRIQAWSKDPAWARYPSTAKFNGDPALYQQFTDAFLSNLDEAMTAAQAQDPGTTMSFMRMRMSCESCHSVFRPGIPPNMPVLGGSGGSDG